MDLAFAIMVFRTGIFQVLVVGAPALIIGMVTGLIVSIFQATTSIQEQTLTFVPKIAAILLSLMFFGPWMMQMLVQYTINLMARIPEMVG
jgi:flagellar biosynthetic protein FliQ